MSDVLPAGLGLLSERRTIRRFRGDDVPPQLIDALIQAACWAPSPHHTRPWRFAVVERGSGRDALATAMGQRWRQDLERDGSSPTVIADRLARSFAKITQAPALIVACAKPDVLDSYPDVVRRAAELTMGAHSLGAAVQNILLAARAQGLGSYWMCAPVFCPDVVVAALALDPTWVPQAFILVGYPAETPPAHQAGDLTELMVRR